MVSVENNLKSLYIDGKPVRKASLGGKVFYQKHSYNLDLLENDDVFVNVPTEFKAVLKDYSDPVEGETVKFYQVFEAEGHLSFTGQTFTVSSNGFSGLGIIIDWGDGTTTTYTNNNSLNHTYATEGDYAISLGGNISSFNSYCFYECTGLTNVVIPDSVTSIGNYCFYYCSDLTSVVIPDSVTSIGTACFYYCYSLTSVVIPDSVTSIGTACFNYCRSLNSIILNWKTNIPTYDSSWFNTSASVPQLSIPNGTLQDYITAGYPSNKLVERGA